MHFRGEEPARQFPFFAGWAMLDFESVGMQLHWMTEYTPFVW